MIKIGNYSFDGPYTDTTRLQERSGIYVILDLRKDGQYYVLDVGESANVKTRVEFHNRDECWIKNHQGTLAVAVFYTPRWQQSGRKVIEQDIRFQYQPVCGVR